MKVELTRNMVSTVRKIIVWRGIQIKLNERIGKTVILQMCGKELLLKGIMELQ